MDNVFILQVLLSAVVGGFFVAFQTWLAERLPQRIAGIAISIPSTVAVALFFMAITTSPEAVAAVAPVIPIGLGAGLMFSVAYIYIANALPLSKAKVVTFSILGAIFMWLLVAAPFAYFEVTNIVFTLSVYATLILLSHYLLSVRPGIQTEPIFIRYTNREKLIRSLIGGTVIGLIVLMTKFLGPFWGGIFSTLPAVYLSTLSIIHWRHGSRFLFHVAKSLPVANPVFAIYVFVVAYTYPVIGIVAGTIVAYMLCALYPLALMRLLPQSKVQ